MKEGSNLLAKSSRICALVAEPKPSNPIRPSTKVNNGTDTELPSRANQRAGKISTIKPPGGTFPSSREPRGLPTNDAYRQLVRRSPAQEERRGRR